MLTLLHDAIHAELLEVEQRLDTRSHKLRKVLNFTRLEIQRAVEQLPGTRELYERIGLYAVMANHLAGQLLNRKVVSSDDRYLVKLLFTAFKRFAASTDELEPQFGPLDFSDNLPELLQAEFGLTSNDAWQTACNIRARRSHVLAHKEEIIAAAKAKGLIEA